MTILSGERWRLEPVLLLIFLFLTPRFGVTQEPRRYDGYWWLSISSEEQRGFLLGRGDCYVYDARGKRRTSKSTAEMQKEVTAFYQANTKRKSRPVIDVVSTLLELPKSPRRQHNTATTEGEVWVEKHAYFDGLWWKGATELERRGFVEGFVTCSNLLLRPMFSKRPERYVDLVDQWYAPPNDAIAATREDEKIANVLLKFADRMQK